MKRPTESPADLARENGDRFRAIFEHAAVGVAEIDSHSGRFLHINRRYCEMVGYDVDEMTKMCFQEITHPDDLEADLDLMAKMRQGVIGEFSLDKRCVRRDGSFVWVALTAAPTWSMGEEPTTHIAVVADITERKALEATLDEREERFRSLAETTAAVIFVTRGAHLLYVNRAAEELSGYSREELVGMPFLDLIHPDFRSLVSERNITRQRGEVIPARYDFPVVTKTDDTRWLDYSSGGIIQWHGEPALIGSAVDITEHRLANTELLAANQRLEERVRARTERLTEALDQMKESRLAALNIMQDALESRSRLEAAHADLVRETADRLRAEEGKALVEEELRQAVKIEAIGRLAGGIAHDFNNIIGVLIGFGELAQEEIEAEHPARASLEQVLDAARRAADLTGQLLAFSRKQVMRPRSLELSEVVRGLETMMRTILGEDIELRLNLAQELGSVVADPSQIHQVILNLAVNARDAMPTGGTLTIETANTDFDADYVAGHPPAIVGGYVMLTVTDTGPGMDAATRERCFEPFFTTKPEGKGTGLGLSTVYGIVKQNSGYIWVYSEPGIGTSFKIFLPRAEIATSAPDVPAAVDTPARGTETVLIVEDMETLRRMLQRVLSDSGYSVLAAADGEEAIELARVHPGPIDLLLSDVVMPRLGGAELARQLSAARPGIRVLFMSGYAEGAISQHGILEPGVDLLEKPFTRDALNRAVRQVLDRRAPD